MGTFVQIHQLRSFPPHVPNRGADGLAKRAIIGGVERQRISSQCSKYALRHHASTMELAEQLGVGMSIRSTLIGERVVAPALEEESIPEAKAWSDAVMALWRAESKRKKASDDEAGAQPIVIGQQEVRLLVAVIKELAAAGKSPDDLRHLIEKKLSKDTPVPIRQATEAFKAARSAAGLDGALFGRFATGVAVSNVHRAITVGEMLTTHAITPIADFFSAVDELKDISAGETGGGHINTRELGGGLFYRHDVVDVEQVKQNLSVDGTGAASVVAWAVKAAYETCPVLDRAHSAVVDMMVEVGPDAPRSLFGAFTRPVAAPDEAVDTFKDYVAERDALDGAPGHRFWLRDHREQPPAYQALAEAVANTIV